MKSSIAWLALPLTVLAQCDPAAVYMIPAQGSMMANNNDHIPVVSQEIAHLAISDFIGTSSLYELESGDQAGILSGLRRQKPLMHASGHGGTVVIGIDNVQELFEEGASLSKRDDVSLTPKFYMENNPGSNSIGLYLHELARESNSTHLGDWSSYRFLDVISTPNSCFKGFKDKNINAVDFECGIIESLVGKSCQDQVFSHLKGLQHLDGVGYEEGKSKIREAVLTLLDEAPSYNVVIISLQKGRCHDMRVEDLMSMDVVPCDPWLAPMSETEKKELLKKLKGGYKATDQNLGSSTEKRSLPSTSSQFSSLSKCEKGTNNCSGHGSCAQLNNGQYHCVCKPTFDKSTQRTTQWGGNACQKIDVSAPFHLLFWSTLGIIVVTVFAIGLLMSIGTEPLPGILGIAKKVDFK